MDIKILFSQMTELFIIMFLGYAIFKFKIVDDNFVKKFSKLILDVTLAAMILSSVLNLDERPMLRDVLTAFAVSGVLFFIVLPVIGILLARLFRVKKEHNGLYIFMHTYSNIGFMGFPVIEAILGPVALFYAAIFNLMFNVSVFSLGVGLVSKKTKFSAKVLLTPGIIVAALSVILYFLNIRLPELIHSTVSSVGSITSPAAMLIVGFTLAKMDLSSVFSDWRIYPWSIIKQLLIPLILFVPFSMIINDETLLAVAFILSAMPVGNNAVLFATRYDCDSELATRAVFITLIISLITLPLCTALVF